MSRNQSQPVDRKKKINATKKHFLKQNSEAYQKNTKGKLCPPTTEINAMSIDQLEQAITQATKRVGSKTADKPSKIQKEIRDLMRRRKSIRTPIPTNSTNK